MGNFWRERKVLITGGASFIGSHLTEKLVRLGSRVKVVDDLSSGRLENLQNVSSEIEFSQGDLKNPAIAQRACSGTETVFHLAAWHGGRGVIDQNQTACSTNLILDSTVFASASKSHVEKVVFASSGCVYPINYQNDPSKEVYLKESDLGPPYNPDGLYGWAKLSAELTLRAYAVETEMKTASCRFFTVYGDRGHENHAIIAMIARSFINQNPYEIWGNGEQIRNWTHVSDITDGLILAAEKVDNGIGINLGTTERIKVLEAAQMIFDYVNFYPKIKFRPEMPTGPLNRVADNRLAKELLNWEPKVKFLNGLQKTIDWYFSSHKREDITKTLNDKLLAR